MEAVASNEVWPTPPGQTIAESSGRLVHIDAQGFVPILPDAHTTNYPILNLPTTTDQVTVSGQTNAGINDTASKFAAFEILLHRIFSLSSLPIDLLIPPYANTQIIQSSSPQLARVGKIAVHPDLPIIALAHAHPGGSIFFFDLRTNAYLKYKLALNNKQQLNALTFSKYNLLAAGMSNGDVLIYELNLSISSSNGSKIPQPAVIPSWATLVPAQFPASAIVGEITDLSFDYISGRYLAISTTRSGTWIYDTIHSSSLRLSKRPSASVAFSPSENTLAIAIENTGDIELYTTIRAGTLSFSLPCVAKSGARSSVIQMRWAPDGKSLLYCNEGQEGIRIMKVEVQSVLTPTAQYLGNILTPLRGTSSGGVPYGGVPINFVLDRSSTHMIISYAKSPLLEVFRISTFGDNFDAQSLGLMRGPPSGKSGSDKVRPKRGEGQSPFDEDLWERATCVDMGFVGQALGTKGSLFVGAWNGDDGARAAFIAFHLDDVSM